MSFAEERDWEAGKLPGAALFDDKQNQYHDSLRIEILCLSKPNFCYIIKIIYLNECI